MRKVEMRNRLGVAAKDFSDPEDSHSYQKAAALLSCLKRAPIFSLPLPAPLATVTGVSTLEARSRSAMVFVASAFYFLFYLDMAGIVVAVRSLCSVERAVFSSNTADERPQAALSWAFSTLNSPPRLHVGGGIRCAVFRGWI